MIRQTALSIPPEIEAGLATGELIRYGGVVRNQTGQIVKHLSDAARPGSAGKLAPRVATQLKSPRVLVGAVAVSAVAAGAGAIAVMTKRKNGRSSPMPECLVQYDAALAAYLEAVRAGQLQVSTIDRLIASLDAVVAYSEETGGIDLDFSTDRAGKLADFVVDVTEKIARENDLDVTAFEFTPLDSDDALASGLRQRLEVQRRLLGSAT